MSVATFLASLLVLLSASYLAFIAWFKPSLFPEWTRRQSLYRLVEGTSMGKLLYAFSSSTIYVWIFRFVVTYFLLRVFFIFWGSLARLELF